MKNTEKITITINDKSYILDLDKAQELKVLMEDKPKRIPEEGDVYEWTFNGLLIQKVLVVQVFYGKDQYQIIGCNGHCYPFRDLLYRSLYSAKELGELLDGRGYVFKKNVRLNSIL
jgi:hypothetical protein